MASEHSAADAIRASVRALPEEARMRWTQYGRTPYVNADGWPIADAAYGSGDRTSVAAHIALLASPDVALALAELLDAEANVREWNARRDAWIAADELEPWAQGAAKADIRRSKAFDALEAAILRSGQ